MSPYPTQAGMRSCLWCFLTHPVKHSHEELGCDSQPLASFLQGIRQDVRAQGRQCWTEMHRTREVSAHLNPSGSAQAVWKRLCRHRPHSSSQLALTARVPC